MRQRNPGPARTPVLNVLLVLLSVATVVLLFITLLGGMLPDVLSQLYYYKVDTTMLSIPSKLSSSEILADISLVSGADLVGQPANAESLDLADYYTVHLLTAIGHRPTRNEAVAAYFGYVFDPASDLRLDRTAVQGKFSESFVNSFREHEKLWVFVAGAHLVAAGVAAYVAGAALFALRWPGLPLLVTATVSSWIVTALGVAASVAEIVACDRFVLFFNDEFEATIGLRAERGLMFVLTVVAAVLSLINSVVLVVKFRRHAGHNARSAVRGSLSAGFLYKDDAEGKRGDDDGAAPGEDGKAKPPASAMKPLTLLQHIPTWNRHRYVPLHEQAPASHSRSASAARGGPVAEDRAVLMMDPAGDDYVGEDDKGYESRPGHGPDPDSADPRRAAVGGDGTAYDPYGSGGRA